MKELLIILKENNIDVPLSPATLLPQVKIKSPIINIQPGQYMHFGIKENLLKISKLIAHHKEIICDVNIDGLPIFKSSSIQLWPILLKVINIENINVFAVGVYVGNKKPASVEEYLSPFVKEIMNIRENGLIINQKAIEFKIRALICDAPAKSFVCGVAHHSSANGCTKCTQLAKITVYWYCSVKKFS